MTDVLSTINKLWSEHESTPFPMGHRAEIGEGINLTSLESQAGGIILSYVATEGKLGSYQKTQLEKFARQFKEVEGLLKSDEARTYFSNLLKIIE